MATYAFSTTTTANLQPMAGSYEEVVVSNTAGGYALTATKYYVKTSPTTQGAGGTQHYTTVLAKQAVITVVTNAVRFTVDGTTPTTGATGTGHDAAAGDVIVLDGFESIRNFKVIRATADATLKVTYFRV